MCKKAKEWLLVVLDLNHIGPMNRKQGYFKMSSSTTSIHKTSEKESLSLSLLLANI